MSIGQARGLPLRSGLKWGGFGGGRRGGVRFWDGGGRKRTGIGFVWRGRGAEFAQRVQGLIEAAVEDGVVTDELAEGVAAGVLVEDVAEGEGVAVVAALGAGGTGRRLHSFVELPFADVLELGGDEAGFDAGKAAETPLGGGDVADQQLFEGCGGLEAGFEGGEELEELGGVLFGEDGLAGEEAVARGVACRVRFALRGLGPGAEAGVFAIGFDLVFGGHRISWRPVGGAFPDSGEQRRGRMAGGEWRKWMRGWEIGGAEESEWRRAVPVQQTRSPTYGCFGGGEFPQSGQVDAGRLARFSVRVPGGRVCS
jgi:hypothetical protein